jgi:hypothetical protein
MGNMKEHFPMELPPAIMTHVFISALLLYMKFCIMIRDVICSVLPSSFTIQFIHFSVWNSELINLYDSMNSTEDLHMLCVKERRRSLAGRATVANRTNTTCLFGAKAQLKDFHNFIVT